MDSFISQVAKNFLYRTKLWMPIILFLIAVLSGISGYLIGARTGKSTKSTKSQLSLQSKSAMISPTPTLIPLLNPTATLYPTTTPDLATVNWQTYIDHTYEFSFKYPPNWSPQILPKIIKTQNNSSIYADEYFVTLYIGNSSHNKRYPNRGSLAMEVTVHTNVNNWTLNEWFYRHTNGYIPQKVSPIDGYQSIQARKEPDIENDFVVAPLLKRAMVNGLYEITLYGNSAGLGESPYQYTDPFIQQELTNFHLVLSSFRFPK